MAGNFFEIQSETNESSDFRISESYVVPSKTDALKAYLSQGANDGIGGRTADLITSFGAKATGSDLARQIAPDVANDMFNPSKPYTEPVSLIDASIRKEREDSQARQAEVIEGSNLSPVLGTLAGFAGAMATDPISLVTGGILGAVTSKLGASITMKVAQKLTVNKFVSSLGTEIAENIAMAALIDVPVSSLSDNIYGTETTAREHMFNIAAGVGMGTAFRMLGHSLGTKFKNDDVTAKTTSFEEFLKAESKDVPPDFQAAMQLQIEYEGSFPDQVQLQIEYDGSFTNPTSRVAAKHAYKIFGEFRGNDFVAVKSGLVTDPSYELSIHRGRSFGGGVHMINSPELAIGRILKHESIDAIKVDIDNFKILNIDQVLPLDSKEIVTLGASLKGFLSEGAITKLLSVPNKLGDILNDLDTRLGDRAGDFFDSYSELLSRTTRYEGFRYSETVGGATYEGVFLFKGTDIDKVRTPDATGATRIEFETAQMRAEFNSIREAEMAEAAAFKAAQMRDVNFEPKQITSDRMGTAIFNENRRLQFQDDMLYSGDSWQATYVETYSPDAIKAFEAVSAKSLPDIIDGYIGDMDTLAATVREIQEVSGMSPEMITLRETLKDIDSATVRAKVDEVEAAMRAAINCLGVE